MGSYKDLQWHDIKIIVECFDSVLVETGKKEILAIGEEGVYNTVVNRVTRIMNKK